MINRKCFLKDSLLCFNLKFPYHYISKALIELIWWRRIRQNEKLPLNFLTFFCSILIHCREFIKFQLNFSSGSTCHYSSLTRICLSSASLWEGGGLKGRKRKKSISLEISNKIEWMVTMINILNIKNIPYINNILKGIWQDHVYRTTWM